MAVWCGLEADSSSAPAQTYEYPSLPCDTFQGRNTVLQHMSYYFDYTPAQNPGQLSFASYSFRKCNL